jgi:hypothetical protein
LIAQNADRRNIVTMTPAGATHFERPDGLIADVQDELPARGHRASATC